MSSIVHTVFFLKIKRIYCLQHFINEGDILRKHRSREHHKQSYSFTKATTNLYCETSHPSFQITNQGCLTKKLKQLWENCLNQYCVCAFFEIKYAAINWVFFLISDTPTRYLLLSHTPGTPWKLKQALLLDVHLNFRNIGGNSYQSIWLTLVGAPRFPGQ